MWKQLACALLLVSVTLAGCVNLNGEEAGVEAEGGGEANDGVGLEVTAYQEDGKLVYWVLPGERRLSEHVFGTPQHPLRTAELEMQFAPPPVAELLRELPFLVGVPLEMRGVSEDGERFTVLQHPTLYSDEALVVNGSFNVTYIDRQPYDLPGGPGNTTDAAELSTRFTDPSGNEYTLELDHIVQPPIPGYETGGGVLTGGFIHGITGTGSPLFPRVYNYGAFWGVGNVLVNGTVVDENKVIHFMTTQIVRNQNYTMAIDEEMPLVRENTIAGRLHHTHGVVLPIKATPQGPQFEPVNTSYMLPNGERQPFIHVMFEEETLEGGPFAAWDWPPVLTEAGPTENVTASEEAATIRIEGFEFGFSPSNVTVQAGQPVTIVFENVGTAAHNLGFDAFGGVRTATIQSGQTDTITFTPEEPGEYPFWCSIPGHREQGMEGTLTVTP